MSTVKTVGELFAFIKKGILSIANLTLKKAAVILSIIAIIILGFVYSSQIKSAVNHTRASINEYFLNKKINKAVKYCSAIKGLNAEILSKTTKCEQELSLHDTLQSPYLRYFYPTIFFDYNTEYSVLDRRDANQNDLDRLTSTKKASAISWGYLFNGCTGSWWVTTTSGSGLGARVIYYPVKNKTLNSREISTVENYIQCVWDKVPELTKK